MRFDDIALNALMATALVLAVILGDLVLTAPSPAVYNRNNTMEVE